VATTDTYDVFGRNTSVQVASLPAQTTQYLTTSTTNDTMCVALPL